MELLNITLAANEIKQFAKAGRYFEIIDSSFAVQVDFTGDQGQRSDSMINALSGLFVEDPFSGFSITNGGTGQNVTLLLMENGRGGSRRQPGVVAVTNKIGSTVQVVGNGGGILLGVGFIAVQLVAPASNTRGIIVRSASAAAQCSAAGVGNYSQSIMVAAPVVPTTTLMNPGLILSGVFNPTTNYIENASYDKNLQIPTGWGVWICASNVGVAALAVGGTTSLELV